MTIGRLERVQIMLTVDELTAIDDWRFGRRMPSRAAAIRELLKRGLAAEGFVLADRDVKSKDFGVVTAKQKGKPSNGRLHVRKVGATTRVDYIPDRGFVGTDTFAVKLLPDQAELKVAATVRGTAATQAAAAPVAAAPPPPAAPAKRAPATRKTASSQR